MTTIRVTATTIPDGFRVRLYCSDGDTFFEAINLLKVMIHPRSRRYDPDQKSWLIYDRSNMMRWCRRLEESWGEVLLDIPISAQQGSSPVNSPLFRALYVTPDAPLDVIKASYKALARLYHPDLVGEDGHDQMVAINRAYEAIMENYR